MGRRSRPNAKGRNVGQFIMLSHRMLKCPAWKTLDPNAKALLLDVWTRHNGSNNGSISYSVREAEAIGLSKSEAARCFAKLTERGFLKERQASSFTVKTRLARTWEVTAEPTGPEGDKHATRDYMQWEESNPQSHRRDRLSHRRDANAAREERRLTPVPHTGRNDGNVMAGLSHPRDTYNIPGGEEGQADNAPPPASTPAPPDSPAEPTASKRPRARPAPDDAGVIDLEELLAGRPDQPSPQEALRQRAETYLAGAPPRGKTGLAQQIGLSRPRLSNWLAGRDPNLSQGATVALRQYLDSVA